MNKDQFTKLVALFDDRQEGNPDAEYADSGDNKASAKISGDLGSAMDALTASWKEVEAKKTELVRLEEELKNKVRESVADLFDASEIVKTRVALTGRFILELSKVPEPTVMPKYKEIVMELKKHLTPELKEVLDGLIKSMITVVEKRPSIKATPIDENAKESSFLKGFEVWADSYDQDLKHLINQATIGA
jgi:hypothetical protein